MKRNLSLTLIIFFLASAICFGQTRRQYIKAAENSFAQQNFYAALKYYEEALKFDSAQTETWFKYGQAAEQFYAFTLAEKAYEIVLKSDEVQEFPTIYLMMAKVKKSLGKYTDAIDYFQKALQNPAILDAPTLDYVKKEIEYCEWAAEVVTNENKNIEIIKLGEEVNTPFAEFGASRYGSQLYYTSFSYVKEDDNFNPPRHYNKVLLSEDNMPGQLWDNINSTGRHTAHAAFNASRDKVYFTYCDYISEAGIRCELYYRQLDAQGQWGAPQKLSESINKAGFTSTEPNVGKVKETGEEWLFFASDQPGGKGKMDIWYAKINQDGTVQNPVNLQAINTEGDDVTPFFHTNTQVLYFSNNSRQGLGNLDIFKSIKSGNNWSEPEHMGYPLNSSYDDFHYTLSPGSAEALMASNRIGSTYLEKEKEACCHDIYVVETKFIELLALTFDDFTKAPLNGATVSLFKMSGERKSKMETKTNPDGNDFNFTPERKEIYIITAERDGYYPYRDTLYLDRPPLDDITSITKEIYMIPAEIDLEVLTFDDYTKAGLTGVNVELVEIDNKSKSIIADETNEVGNDFKFKIRGGRSYIIKGKKQGYEMDLDTIDQLPSDLRNLKSLRRELYLRPLIFAEFLPLTLYFDNDEPDQNSWATATRKSYLETWEGYYPRKQVFLDEFGKGMTQEMKFLANQRIEDFFEREVKSGGEAMKVFSDLLYEFLRQGNKLEIVLRGYTSPRAASDYNQNLSKRRISSVRNHFEQYKEGIFKPFMQEGKLVILEKPYGETKAKGDVSDKLNDVRNSIFGVPASLERRVEIIDVRQADDL